ncbi:753_t:CDS:2, partial [Funneliformis geosporum]
ITEKNTKLTESNRKLETVTKENSENEKVLEQLLKEFKELGENWIQLRKIVQGNYFQLSKIHAYLTRSDVVDMARRINKSFADSEDNPNLSFVIYEDYDPNKPTIEE